MINEGKVSFILYKKYYEILKDFLDCDLGVLFRTILQYQATGDVGQLPANIDIAFRFIKNQFDVDEKKYNKFIEKQSSNGLKGGRPKSKQSDEFGIIENEDNENQTDFILENPKNPTLFFETQKSLNEKEKEKEKENENVLSHQEQKERELNIPSERRDITEHEKQLIVQYVLKNKLARKNVRAYVNRIIENGDHREILEREKKKLYPQETHEARIKREIASIIDKPSAAKILYRYHASGSSPPKEFDEIMDKYDLDTYDKLYAYCLELANTS